MKIKKAKPRRNGVKLLRQAMIGNDSLACCGLDPDLSKMPLEFRGKLPEDTARKFLEIVADLTAPHICAYKIQKACFDLEIFSGGHKLLKGIVNYIHERYPELPVFVDAKIGDVKTTMEFYLRNLFGELNADGVTVDPYLGDDVLLPFEKFPDKVAIVTVKTSNPGAAIVQDILLQDGRPLWEYILNLTATRWNGAGNMIPVIGSTIELNFKKIRASIPDSMPILVTGYGAQGGSAAHLRDLVDSKGRGVFVNSSRALLYPFDVRDPHWRDAIVRTVIAMKDELNRFSKTSM